MEGAVEHWQYKEEETGEESVWSVSWRLNHLNGVSYWVTVFANLVFLTPENVFGPKNGVLGKIQEAMTSPEHLDQEGNGEDTTWFTGFLEKEKIVSFI